MSHFLTLVLIDASESKPAGKAKQLMWPYFADDLGERTPQSKFDGFTIGGRYDGAIWGKEQHYSLTPEEYQQRYGLDVVRPEDNIRPVSELVPDCLPNAIITPDGCWHDDTPIRQCMPAEREPTWLVKIGNRVQIEQSQAQRTEEIWSEWIKQCRSLLRTYEGCIAVAFDCHC
jgi:hypothetical protein